MSDRACPARGQLLASAGEHVPHLSECAECAAFVAAATGAVSAFADRAELERAVSAEIDAVLDATTPHRWRSALIAARDLHRSIVVRELLRRADDAYGTNPRTGLDFTDAAIAICEAMTASGNAPAPELYFEALKEHSTLLRRVGATSEALAVLGRAWSVALQTKEHERHRAVLSLCAAIIYSDRDVGRFDDAIELAETAAAVLDICGDKRRAALARQTKAYALIVMDRFAEALPLLRDVTVELPRAGCNVRDEAIAHALVALCLLSLGSPAEAIEHGQIAQRLHAERGDVIDAARAAHVVACGRAALGRFAEVRDDFTRAAEIVFNARLFDVWAIMRLDYVAAALADDAGADVRADLESVARVAFTVDGPAESTLRRRYASEALAYLRQLAVRDAVTREVVDHVRAYVVRNASRPAVKFVPPPLATFVM